MSTLLKSGMVRSRPDQVVNLGRDPGLVAGLGLGSPPGLGVVYMGCQCLV
jgi:hypothetical protein